MNMLSMVVRLANVGFYLFPLRPNSKIPAIKDFTSRATRDLGVLGNWWLDNTLEPQPNIGIITSRFSDCEALIVVDVDQKNGKDGLAELQRLERSGRICPPTLTQITPTGGRHLIYRSQRAVKGGVNKLGPGIDIKSYGGYIVGAGSTINGKAYAFLEN